MPMPLRPNSPMQQGFGPRMMPPRYHGTFQNQSYHFSPPTNMPFPMGGRPQGARNGGGGGLIAKLLGRGKQQSGMQGAFSAMNRSAGAASGSGGILKALTNPESLNGFLNNTQTVLKTAQQIAPMIQQYGPLVRNLPSLWKLYKGLKDAGDTVEEDDVQKVTEENTVAAVQEQESSEVNTITATTTIPRTKKKKTNKKKISIGKELQSKPKLYI